MNTLRRKSLHAAILAGLATVAFTMDASAQQSVGQIARNVSGSILDSVSLVNAIAYIAGAIFALLSAFKFKAWRDDPRETKMGVPITLFVVAALCIFLPEFIGTSKTTIWGTNATQVTPDSNRLQIR